MPRVPSPREKIWTKENNPLEWIEGHVEGVTGWAIGDRYDAGIDLAEEANSLYDTLEHVILPLFYGQPDAYAEIRRSTIALNSHGPAVFAQCLPRR